MDDAELAALDVDPNELAALAALDAPPVEDGVREEEEP